MLMLQEFICYGIAFNQLIIISLLSVFYYIMKLQEIIYNKYKRSTNYTGTR